MCAGPEIIAALADCLRISRDAVSKRVNLLFHLDDDLPSLPSWDHNSETLNRLETGFYGSFCRMCRSYGCRVHGGGHPRPRQGPFVVHSNTHTNTDNNNNADTLMMHKRFGIGTLNNQRLIVEDVAPLSIHEAERKQKKPCGKYCALVLHDRIRHGGKSKLSHSLFPYPYVIIIH